VYVVAFVTPAAFTASTAIVAPTALIAVAIRLTHHSGGTILEGVDADCEVAEHVLMEAFLALDLVQRCGRRIDIEQRHVRFAVLADAIGEGLQAPIFVLGDFAAHLPDDSGQLGGQFFDLLRAQILARKVDVFVQRHECLSLRFKSSVLDPGAKPLEPFGERLECSEGESTGRRFSSQPGSTERAVYRRFWQKRKANAGSLRMEKTPHSLVRVSPDKTPRSTARVFLLTNCRCFSLTEPPMRCLSARFLRQIEYGQLWRSLSYFPGRAARP